MPFDAAPAVTTPSLATLSAILRDRTRWPADFRWDYGRCDMCALGMAWRLGFATHPLPSKVMPAFGLSIEDDDAFNLFVGVGSDLGKHQCDVTPEDVADAIDTHLARQVA